MKFSRPARANRVGRVSTRVRIFGLRISHLTVRPSNEREPSGCLASAFTGLKPIGLCRATAAQWRFVMRNRSATVADSHGLPRCPGCWKERRSQEII